MKATTINERHISKSGFGARLLFYILLLSIIGLSKVFAAKSDVSAHENHLFSEKTNVENVEVVNFHNPIVR